ncbi:MAG: hypothetical protein AAB795_00890 [Patescibacteria group bacterium]
MKKSGVIIGLLVLLSGCAGWHNANSGTIILENEEIVECPRGIKLVCDSLFLLVPNCTLRCYFKYGDAIFMVKDVTSVHIKNK